MFIELAITLTLLWLVWFVIATFVGRRKMPPGPFPLPFVGNAHQIGMDPTYSMETLREKYGDIYTISFPVGTFVVVNSGKLMQEALVARKDDFAGRPDAMLFPINAIFEGKDILFSDYGHPLIFRRKVVTSALHVFGKGVHAVERRINKEVEQLIELMEATEGRPFSPQLRITATITNVISEWLLSTRYDFDDPNILKVLFNFNDKLVELASNASFHHFFPFLKYLPTEFMKSFEKVMETRESFFTSHFDHHQSTYEEGVVRDITDALLSAYATEKGKNRGKDVGKIDDVKFIMMDIFLATIDTTSSVLTWFMLFMILNEDVQDNVQREMDKVIGRDRSPSWQDARNLPYLQATICEVMRLSGFLPIDAPHKAIRDSTIQGYHIPKGTTVLFNFWQICLDSRVWEQPELFNPSRFLDENGKFVGWETFPSFRPFGDGRRACVGKALGKMQVFVVTSKMLHHFRFSIPPGQPKPTLEAKMTGIRYPNKYELCARKRL